MYTQLNGLTKILIFYGSPRGACIYRIVKYICIPRIFCNNLKHSLPISNKKWLPYQDSYFVLIHIFLLFMIIYKYSLWSELKGWSVAIFIASVLMSTKLRLSVRDSVREMAVVVNCKYVCILHYSSPEKRIDTHHCSWRCWQILAQRASNVEFFLLLFYLMFAVECWYPGNPGKCEYFFILIWIKLFELNFYVQFDPTFFG